MKHTPIAPIATSAVAPIIQIQSAPAQSFDVLGLSPLIGLSVRSIQTYRTRFPERLPRACSPPGSRNPIWLLEDVLNWLASHREPAAALPVPPPVKPVKLPKSTDSPRGRPSLTEVSAAAAAGFKKKNGDGDVTGQRAALRANSEGGAA